MKIRFSKRIKILLLSLVGVLAVIFLIGFTKLPISYKNPFKNDALEEQVLKSQLEILLKKAEQFKNNPTELPKISTKTLEVLLPILQIDFETRAQALAEKIAEKISPTLNEIQKSSAITDSEYIKSLVELIETLYPIPDNNDFQQAKEYYSQLVQKLLQISPPPEYLEYHQGLILRFATIPYLIDEIQQEEDMLYKNALIKLYNSLVISNQ